MMKKNEDGDHLTVSSMVKRRENGNYIVDVQSRYRITIPGVTPDNPKDVEVMYLGDYNLKGDACKYQYGNKFHYNKAHWESIREYINKQVNVESVSFCCFTLSTFISNDSYMNNLLESVSQSKTCMHIDLTEMKLYDRPFETHLTIDHALETLHEKLLSDLTNISSIGIFEDSFSKDAREYWIKDSKWLSKIFTILSRRQLGLEFLKMAHEQLNDTRFVNGVNCLQKAINFYPTSSIIQAYFKKIAMDLTCPRPLYTSPSLRLYLLEHYQSYAPDKKRFIDKRSHLKEIIEECCRQSLATEIHAQKDNQHLNVSARNVKHTKEISILFTNYDQMCKYTHGSRFQKAYDTACFYIDNPEWSIMQLLPTSFRDESLRVYQFALKLIFDQTKNETVGLVMTHLEQFVNSPSILETALDTIEMTDKSAFEKTMEQVSSKIEQTGNGPLVNDFKCLFRLFHTLSCRNKMVRCANEGDFESGLTLVSLVDLNIYSESQQQFLTTRVNILHQLKDEHKKELERQREQDKIQQHNEQKQFEMRIDDFVFSFIDSRIETITVNKNPRRYKSVNDKKRRALFIKLRPLLSKQHEFFRVFFASDDQDKKNLFIKECAAKLDDVIVYEEVKLIKDKVTINLERCNPQLILTLILDRQDGFNKPAHKSNNGVNPYKTADLAANNVFTPPSCPPTKSMKPSPVKVRAITPQPAENPQWVAHQQQLRLSRQAPAQPIDQQQLAQLPPRPSPTSRHRKPLPVPPTEVTPEDMSAYETPPAFDPTAYI